MQRFQSFLTLGEYFEQERGLRLPELGPEQLGAVEAARDYLQQAAGLEAAVYYGVNTGFGSLCDVRISAGDLETLQLNLLRSHACGVGPLVPQHLVRRMLGLKWRNLALGYSGVKVETLERLALMYEKGVLPLVYELGSLGASGDLSPLAHLSLPLIGEGEVWWQGRPCSSAEVLAHFSWSPLRLGPKEGLALLNGTQFSLSYGLEAYYLGAIIAEAADAVAALSVEAFACQFSPFDARLQAVRAHAGQVLVAERLRGYLADSPRLGQGPMSVQDPYAFRCVPQVHGASRDALAYVAGVLERELNSVTDNPTVFAADNCILSGGNFHAQALALSLDFLALALCEWGNISERRLYQLISGKRGLPPFLTRHSGLHSGMMIAQYTAASVVSQNKQLASPASVDSIVSCNGQEDHVSMAANAATKVLRIAQNALQVLGIELMAACQALRLRGQSPAPALQPLYEAYCAEIPFLEEDRFLSPDLQRSRDFLQKFFAPK